MAWTRWEQWREEKRKEWRSAQELAQGQVAVVDGVGEGEGAWG